MTSNFKIKKLGSKKSYKCNKEECGRSFTRENSLKKHIHTVHEGHKDYNCESCGKSFSRSNSLNRHFHTIHKDGKDQRHNSCDKLFSM